MNVLNASIRDVHFTAPQQALPLPHALIVKAEPHGAVLDVQHGHRDGKRYEGKVCNDEVVREESLVRVRDSPCIEILRWSHDRHATGQPVVPYTSTPASGPGLEILTAMRVT